MKSRMRWIVIETRKEIVGESPKGFSDWKPGSVPNRRGGLWSCAGGRAKQISESRNVS